MKKKILFIINPISGVGKHQIAEKLVTENLDHKNFDYEFAYTKAAKHAIELSKKATEENFDVVVAVGGDGSVNEIGKSLVKTKTALAILPCGSGNGTARHLRIPVNLKKAMMVINRMKIKSIDTFCVNEETVINIAGIGYAAHIAREFSGFGKRGFSNYIKIALRDMWKYKSQICEIEFDGKKFERTAFIIDICNGTQWGNNAVIAPHAKNDDGLLDIYIINDFPFYIFPVMATRLFTRSIHRSGYVEIYRVKEIIIRQEKSYAHLDGEPTETGNELKVKINPGSLKMIVP
ncbi:MAG: YegS/Rv2252/BmrU family lipid kinase [Bacteroidota bacterium]